MHRNVTALFLASSLTLSLVSACRAQSLGEAGAVVGIGSGAGAAASKAFRQGTITPGAALNAQQLRTVQFLTAKYEKEIDTQKRSGNSPAAAKAELELAKMRQAYYGAGDKTAQESYQKAAEFFTQSGNHSEAASAYRQGLSACQKRTGQGSHETLPLMANLADALVAANETAEATSFYKNALVLQERSSGANSEESVGLRLKLAQALIKISDYPAAEDIVKKQLEQADQGGKIAKSDRIGLLESYSYILHQTCKVDEESKVKQQIDALKAQPSGNEEQRSSATTSGSNIQRTIDDTTNRGDTSKVLAPVK